MTTLSTWRRAHRNATEAVVSVCNYFAAVDGKLSGERHTGLKKDSCTRCMRELRLVENDRPATLRPMPREHRSIAARWSRWDCSCLRSGRLEKRDVLA